jgi:(p)ppGpp synthase/HD superfamily hydrolase
MFQPTERLWDALEFAAAQHREQVRKGTGIPYLVHPLGVMQLLIEHDAPEPAVVAGVLHDVLEDGDATISDLEAQFGADVARLVAALSEPDKGAAWEDRKRHTIHDLEDATQEVLLAACADKLHNLRSIQVDLASQGDALWERFKRGRKQQAWYYRELAKVFTRRGGGHALFRLFADLVGEVFPG